jgi:serine/threonine-protein kinase RsbW
MSAAATGPTTPPTTDDDDRVKVTIPTDFSASRDVQKAILDEVVRCRYDEGAVFAIKLALEEGMANAIKHGNKFDKGKRVHVEYEVTPTRFEVSIEDEGAGFDVCEVPDPTLEENLEKCSGRGILLIGAYMTKVEYRKGGRQLYMLKVNDKAGA